MLIPQHPTPARACDASHGVGDFDRAHTRTHLWGARRAAAALVPPPAPALAAATPPCPPPRVAGMVQQTVLGGSVVPAGLVVGACCCRLSPWAPFDCWRSGGPCGCGCAKGGARGFVSQSPRRPGRWHRQRRRRLIPPSACRRRPWCGCCCFLLTSSTAVSPSDGRQGARPPSQAPGRSVQFNQSVRRRCAFGLV
jgi:hypothetical protein